MVTIITTPYPEVEISMTLEQYKTLCNAVSNYYEALRHDRHEPDLKREFRTARDLTSLLPDLVS